MSDRRAKYIILTSIIFVGIVGISQGQGLFELNDVNTITPKTSFGYLGHVTAIVKDSDGNIKAYRQADNVVGHVGRDCAADLVFDTGLGDDCAMVEYMAIGTATNSFMFTQTNLFDKTANGNVLLSQTNDIFLGIGTLTKIAAGGDNAVVEYRKSFLILAADSGKGIGESGLFDGASEDSNMFARSIFLPALGVTTDDQVTIRWVITTVGVT